MYIRIIFCASKHIKEVICKFNRSYEKYDTFIIRSLNKGTIRFSDINNGKTLSRECCFVGLYKNL